MSSRKDPLFKIFEHHLFNAMVEDESSSDFVERVVQEYIKTLSASGTVPHAHREALAADLQEEVMEMLRKKTYGHFSLTEFRKKKMAANAAIANAVNHQAAPRAVGATSTQSSGKAAGSASRSASATASVTSSGTFSGATSVRPTGQNSEQDPDSSSAQDPVNLPRLKRQSRSTPRTRRSS